MAGFLVMVLEVVGMGRVVVVLVGQVVEVVLVVFRFLVLEGGILLFVGEVLLVLEAAEEVEDFCPCILYKDL